MTLGEKIAQLRCAAGLSQEQLAEAMEVSRQAVSKWENDQAAPEVNRIVRLCALFSVSADEMLGLEKREETQRTHSVQGRITIRDVERSVFARRCLTMGWITAAVGALVVALGYLLLWPIRNYAVDIAINSGMGFRSDVMWYAGTMPMSAVFLVGALLILSGLALTGSSFYLMKKPREEKEGDKSTDLE